MLSPFLDRLSRGIVVFDGGMGTQIHKVDLSLEDDYCGCENCTDILSATRPDVIQAIHERYLEAGADVVETNTFGGSKLVLAEFGIADRTYEIAKSAGEAARAAADKHSIRDKPRFVAGSMGPGTKLITLGNTTWDVMLDAYRECARGLIDGGVDLIIIETCQDLLQVKCAINAALAALKDKNKSPLDIPIMASVTIESTGTMLLGTAIEAAATALAGYPIISLGLNCATGPTEMAEHVHWLGKHWRGSSGAPSPGGVALHGGSRHLSVMPNAGLPVLHEGRTEYPLRPQPFVEAMQRFIEHDGVNIVGGCCGTTPDHIKLLAEYVESFRRKMSSTEKHGEARSHARRENADDPASSDPSAISAPSAVSSSLPKGVTSLYSVADYRQDSSFLIVGERMNASGSKAFKRLLEAEDWDAIVSLAKEQLREGAHVLDLNVDYAGRDNARDMAEIVKRVVRQADAPLMLDSTQLKTIEAGLRHAGGKCIINSANFEEGEHKFDQVMLLAKTYGSAVVIGSIDEDQVASMARTADRKFSIAQRALRRAVDVFGLDPADILFDPLVLPISTGMESDRRSALELIEGVRRISAAFPDSQTVVGLSNVSFGLNPAARLVLNSAFLHELRQAGLTGAIVHAGKILPRNRIPDDQWAAALDLIYDRRETGDPLARFIELFKDAAAATTTREVKNLTLEEQLRAHIIDGEKQGLNDTLDAALDKYAPLDIINDHLLDGMKTVGEFFGSGRMQLPFVLQSAEVMKMAVSQLEPLMKKKAGTAKGSIVLATVKGDVHDIGKNLVDIILTNNGFKVINIGIKQHLPQIMAAYHEHKPDAIGLSGLLVKSVNVMEENIDELNRGSDRPRLILGGAALTRHYCEGHLRPKYNGECYYGKDAFDGLRIMDLITSGKSAQLATEINERQGKRSKAEEMIVATRAAKLAGAQRDQRESAPTDTASQDAPQRARSASESASSSTSSHRAPTTARNFRSGVSTSNPVPTPPFWGSRVIDSLDLDDIYPFINPVALFRGQWGFKKGAMSDSEYDAMLEDKVAPIFNRLKALCKSERILQPRVVDAYFPCNSDGDDLIIWDHLTLGAPGFSRGQDDSPTSSLRLSVSSSLRERLRFNFPRQSDKRRLCISDFFRPINSGEVDVIGMHCVTMGKRASEAAKALYAKNEYQEYLYLHGMGVETAEALAEFWHKRMRQELGIATEDSPKIKELFTQHYRGSRYSFGYPACPDMSDQEKLFALLDPSRIGCELTENHQIDPEQSTSAIIVHHPEAKYFNV